MTTATDSPENLLVAAKDVTVASSLTYAMTCLQACTDAPQLESEILLAFSLECARTHLFAHPEIILQPQQLVRFSSLVERRAAGEPLPYLTGHVEFYGLNLRVDQRVLIPRPETETLIDLALAYISRRGPRGAALGTRSRPGTRPTLVDVGTGSGCIAIAVALRAPDAIIFAIDISDDALSVARENARRHVPAITFLQSDLLEALPEPVDVIISNPPYVAPDEWSGLSHEISEHEPKVALDGGLGGLTIIQRILDQAPSHLSPGGALFLEIGASQGETVTQLARRAFPNAALTIHTDLAGCDRVLSIDTGSDPR